MMQLGPCPLELLLMDEDYEPTGVHMPDSQRLFCFEQWWGKLSRDQKELTIAAWNTRTPPASQSDEAKAVAASLRGWAAGTTNSYEGEQLKERLLQAAALLDRPPQSIPTASQSEALVEELRAALLNADVDPPYDPSISAIIPIITAREAAARREAIREMLEMAIPNMAAARAKGKREGIEDAAVKLMTLPGGDMYVPAIRTLAEKQP